MRINFLFKNHHKFDIKWWARLRFRTEPIRIQLHENNNNFGPAQKKRIGCDFEGI